MATTEFWITFILSLIFTFVAAYIAIGIVLSAIKDIIRDVFEDYGDPRAFMSLLVVVVYILFFKQIINLVSNLPQAAEAGSALSYITVLKPGIELLDMILPFIGWIILGVLIAFGFRFIPVKKKR